MDIPDARDSKTRSNAATVENDDNQHENSGDTLKLSPKRVIPQKSTD